MIGIAGRLGGRFHRLPTGPAIVSFEDLLFGAHRPTVLLSGEVYTEHLGRKARQLAPVFAGFGSLPEAAFGSHHPSQAFVQEEERDRPLLQVDRLPIRSAIGCDDCHRFLPIAFVDHSDGHPA
jgi:hypothetical protein